MEIAFETEEIRELCERFEASEKEFGHHTAGNLRAILADMRAATSVADVLFAEPSKSESDDASVISVAITPSCSLKFTSNHP